MADARAASRTAIAVAVQRALHQLVDGEPKVLDDRVSAALVEADAAARARAAGKVERGLRAHVVLRSRFAEERLEAAVARGVRQCVVLGAGFDTFAFRQPPWARALRVFEVDHPASQALKRARLQAARIAVPANVSFVPLDFERMALDEGLARGGVALDAPVFFSWLGVMMYVDEAAIDAVFRCVAQRPRGSEIAFDFARPAASIDDGAERIAGGAAALGEPWCSRFTPEALLEKLHGLGLHDVSLLTGNDARRYFSNRSDGLQPPRRTGIGSAVV